MDPAEFRYSASQITTFRRCPRKWFFEKLVGLERGSSSSAAAGTAIHGEVEEWFKNAVVPTSGAALALLRHLPTPGPGLTSASVETEFRLITPPGIVSGYMDLCILEPELIPESRWPEYWRGYKNPIVKDHKTVRSLDYAKSELDLRLDPQALIYGFAARALAKAPMPEEVGLQWTYVERGATLLGFDGRQEYKTKPVRVKQSLTLLEDGLTGIFATATEMRTVAVSGCRAVDVESNPEACKDFGGCPYLKHCPTGRGDAPVTTSNTESIFEKLRGLKVSDPPPTPPAPKPVLTVEMKAPALKPTPEPDIRAVPVDVAGTEVPLPVGALGVLPPDVPPEPALVEPAPEVVEVKEKPKGKKKKAAETSPALAHGLTGVLALEADPLGALLSSYLTRALDPSYHVRDRARAAEMVEVLARAYAKALEDS